jgi:hypothetical protein
VLYILMLNQWNGIRNDSLHMPFPLQEIQPKPQPRLQSPCRRLYD